MQPRVGRTLGRYRLEASLGKGGMAEVFRATDTRLHRTVAVKVILPLYAAEREFMQRFRLEARLVAALEHPNVLPVYDFGEEDGLAYLVMPFVADGTLAGRLATRVPLEQALRWIEGLAGALDAAHRAGILHRDVKPQNVLLGQGDRALLADFGIAKMGEGATRLTSTGVVVGTPHYMAPELARGGTASPASDLYALAVLAFELLTGGPPFDGETALAVLHQHVHTPPPRATARSLHLPRAVDAVFERGLAKSADQRFRLCSEFAASLLEAAGVAPGFVAAPAAAFGDSALGSAAGSPTMRTVALGSPPTRTRAPRPGGSAAVDSRDSGPGAEKPSTRGTWGALAAAGATGLLAWWLVAQSRSPESFATTRTSGQVAASPAPDGSPQGEWADPGGQLEVSTQDPIWSEAARLRKTGPSLRGGMRRLTREDFELLATAPASGSPRPRGSVAGLASTYGRGGLAYLTSRDAEAEAALITVVSSAPGIPFLDPALVSLLRSATAKGGLEAWQVALGYGDARLEAAALLAGVRSGSPEDPEAALGEALVSHLNGDHRGAAAQAEQVYRREPRPRIASFVAHQFYLAGDSASSLRWYETASNGSGMDAALAAYQGAQLARELGSPQVARNLLETACSQGLRVACIDRQPARRTRRPGGG